MYKLVAEDGAYIPKEPVESETFFSPRTQTALFVSTLKFPGGLSRPVGTTAVLTKADSKQTLGEELHQGATLACVDVWRPAGHLAEAWTERQ